MLTAVSAVDSVDGVDIIDSVSTVDAVDAERIIITASHRQISAQKLGMTDHYAVSSDTDRRSNDAAHRAHAIIVERATRPPWKIAYSSSSHVRL